MSCHGNTGQLPRILACAPWAILLTPDGWRGAPQATHVYRTIGTATALVALLLAACYAAELAQDVLEQAQAEPDPEAHPDPADPAAAAKAEPAAGGAP